MKQVKGGDGEWTRDLEPESESRGSLSDEPREKTESEMLKLLGELMADLSKTLDTMSRTHKYQESCMKILKDLADGAAPVLGGEK